MREKFELVKYSDVKADIFCSDIYFNGRRILKISESDGGVMFETGGSFFVIDHEEALRLTSLIMEGAKWALNEAD